MKFGVREFRFHWLPLETRFPFRYGIASMTSAPHVFVEAHCEVDGHLSKGLAADLFPPKWFTKNPDTTFEDDDLPAMEWVLGAAAERAIAVGEHRNLFCWWRGVYESQQLWAAEQKLAPLLAGFGVSLVERAALDAICRHLKTPLHQLVSDERLGIALNEVRPQVTSEHLNAALAQPPLATLQVRHTVGLGDPLRDSEITEDERTTDGLPHSLEANIREYGLTYFKIKLRGDRDADCERLEQLADLFEEMVGEDVRVTVDGNENYRDIASFQEHWRGHVSRPRLQRLLTEQLLMVEQPIHRDYALVDEVQTELASWRDAPPIIIDESDADLSSAPRAFQLGYRGVSHKNCKGVIKGLANAAEAVRLREMGRDVVLSAEDLANFGPVALTQDLAVVAMLGVTHVERNGHHYFAGLSSLPEAEQQRVLQHHSDLFELTPNGFAGLRIRSGQLQCSSVNGAPFGYGAAPDLAFLSDEPT